MSRIGVVGLGAMGWSLAATLVNGQRSVIVYDADSDRTRAFAAEYGCMSAERPGDLKACEAIVMILPNGDIVRRVLAQENGGELADGLEAGSVIIDMSSSSPLGTIQLAAELGRRGVLLVDAPISKQDSVFRESGVPRASDKPLPLVLMVGGEPDAVAKARPILEVLGETIVETGGPGSGHAAKTLNNYAAAGAHVALGEALLMGKRFGLDEKTLIDIINVSTGRSFISQVLMKNRLENDGFRAGFSIGLMAKDARITSELAEYLNFDAPACRLVRERWDHARDTLGADADVADAIPAWDSEA